VNPFLLFSGVVAAVLLWGWIETLRFRIVKTEFRSPRVPEEFHGYRLILIGGLHLRRKGRWNDRLVSRLKKLGGDLLLIGGNVKPTHRSDNQKVHRRLRHLLDRLSYPDGILCVRGYRDRKRFWEEAPADPPYHLLTNDHFRIARGDAGISVLGLQTAHASHLDRGINQLREALGTLEESQREDLRILLGQSPDLLRVAQGLPIDLILSVDNLFYQVRIPGLGMVPRRDSKVPWSWEFGWKNEGRIGMYLSPGLGKRWLPFRFFCRPQIVCVELEHAARSVRAES
jgi:predicted MPP superfamily phosphohydrolase